MRRILLFLFLLSTTVLFSQSQYWQFQKPGVLTPNLGKVVIQPLQFVVSQLDVAQIKAQLLAAPDRFAPNAKQEAVLVQVPNPEGQLEDFWVLYAPLMHPELAAQFPETRTYSGWAVNAPSKKIRLDVTPWGFHAMVLNNLDHDATWFVDPLFHGNTKYYQSYYKKNAAPKEDFECMVNGKEAKFDPEAAINQEKAGDCKLRQYRLALACTGEYSTYYGGTVALVNGGFNTTMNRVNGVFENEIGVTLQLVANNNSLIFLNSTTDGLTNNDGGLLLNEGQGKMDNIIGSANYDVGHVFSTGAGGVAGLGVICATGSKGLGVTGRAAPIGDAYDIDYVAHEMGHQFGAAHTYNNSCGNNVNTPTAYEPGSGSTIMAYAGICAPNVQNNSDPYFHAVSLQQIAAVIAGTSCPTIINTTNTGPTANAGLDYTVPFSTPLVLSGTGTDANGDTLSYGWEQFNNGSNNNTAPNTTGTLGPQFRSKSPTAANTRFLPPLANVIANSTNTWEVLPAVARTMNFRLTVRDNEWLYGCTAEDNMIVTVNGASGPFAVTSPNTNTVSWAAGSTQTVTWNVLNTNLAPINCANVRISLSTDGGNTYPISLVETTSNDGTQAITLPASVVPTTQARVRVQGIGNIFYDISNANFAITALANGYALSANPNTVSTCAGSTVTAAISAVYAGSFTSTVALATTVSNPGLTATLSSASFSGSGTVVLNIATASTLLPGTYSVTVSGSGGGVNSSTVVSVVVLPLVGVTSLLLPADAASNTDASPLLDWAVTPNAVSYNLQVSTSNTFNSTVININSVTDQYQVTATLNAAGIYYWRVQGVNSCGVGVWSSMRSFIVGNNICTTVAASNLPIAISAGPANTINSTLNFAGTGTITDVNLVNLAVNHSYINDLVIKLKSPDGTILTLLSQPCASEDNINVKFDDQATNLYTALPCPPTNGLYYKPFQALSGFDGLNANGTWTLAITDVANEDGGSLTDWSIKVCRTTIVAPVIVATATSIAACNGSNNGAATATATGGTTPYSYNWSNGSTSATATLLATGSYSVTATDATGNTGTVVVTVANGISPLLTATSTNAAAATGAIDLSVSGVTASTFDWSNDGAETPNNDTEDLINLIAANYTVTVTSDLGCTAQLTVPVFCAQSGNSSTMWIQKFTAGTINNTSGNNNGFGNYTNLSTTAVPGANIQGVITKGFTGVSPKVYYRVFIDLNQDGDLNDSGERVLTKTFTGNTNSFSFVVPTTATAGPARMRVSARLTANVSNACATNALNGETEDYTINIASTNQLVGNNNNNYEIESLSALSDKLTVFPNPTDLQTQIVFESEAKATTTLRIFDALGNMQIQQNWTAEAGTESVVVATDQLANGVYFVRVQQGQRIMQTRIVVQR